MSEMIERVARALAESESGKKDFYDSLDVLTRGAFQRDARAAIEAMREPTKEMERAGDDMMRSAAFSHSVWLTMVDEALAKADA